MSILNFFSRQLVEVIDWTEEPGELAIRYSSGGLALKNGAQLTVREGQIAFLYEEGQIADIFGPGLHTLVTSNLPVLTALLNWDTGFASPFKTDVYFYTSKEQFGLTWGTSQPIAVHDPNLGPVELRGFGRYSFRIEDAGIFAAKLMGTLQRLTVPDIEPQLRAVIATAVATTLGSTSTGFFDLACDQSAMSERLQAAVQPAFAAWGLGCTSFFIESLSLPNDAWKRVSPNTERDLPLARNAKAPDAGSPQPAIDGDPSVMIKKLHTLLVGGALSQAEYDAKKVELLIRIR
jgi:membrane protease subunit (stomatin/prohibitin family)